MPANNRRRKIKDDAVGRSLIKEKGGINEKGNTRRKAIKAASEFHIMPHMSQGAPTASDFISGDAKTMHIKSVIERNALDEFLEHSLGSQILHDKENAIRVLIKQSDNQMKSQHNPTTDGGSLWERIIPIPRRPINYVSGRPVPVLNPTKLAQMEQEVFLKWRLELSKIEDEEGRIMTPFERNLEFWRQLWRVLERSEVVIQILDARNPLFFRSIDMETYVKEIHADKEVILLMNKSDLVPEHVRQVWAHWFKERGIGCLFFSALEELTRQGVMEGNDDRKQSGDCSDDSSDDSLGKNNILCEDSKIESDSNLGNSDNKKVDRGIQAEEIKNNDINGLRDIKESVNDSSESDLIVSDKFFEVLEGETFDDYIWKISSTAKVLTALELLQVLQGIGTILRERINKDVESADKNVEANILDEEISVNDDENSYSSDDSGSCHIEENKEQRKNRKHKNEVFVMRRNQDCFKFVVGFAGYPNVGKSSVINSLLGHKVVAVSRQPGKTKHFQTIDLPTVGLTLCDCPGLVFPQIVSTKAHLVVNGIVHIDHVRNDFLPPIQIICNYIPHILIRQYNLDTKVFLSSSANVPHHQIFRQHFNKYSTDSFPSDHPRLDASQFLTFLAASRGYISGGKGGVLDLGQAARLVLRDFISGKHPHFVLPPGCSNLAREVSISAKTPSTTESRFLHSEPNCKENFNDSLLSDLLVDEANGSCVKKPTKRALRQMEKRAIRGKGSHSVSNHKTS